MQFGFDNPTLRNRLLVHKISLTVTVFKSLYGKMITIPNYILADTPIINLKVGCRDVPFRVTIRLSIGGKDDARKSLLDLLLRIALCLLF